MKNHPPEYFEDFRWIVLAGITCGLDHPIEWAANAWRTPGGTLSSEYYQRMQLSVPRFLIDVYEAQGPSDVPMTPDVVIGWANKHFENNEMFVGFFDIFRPGFEHLLKGADT